MNTILAFALKHRVLMVVLFVMMLGGGVAAFRALNIEAYPDPVPPMVDVITQSPGLSAEEIERYITIPIETQVAGVPNLQVMRTISLYGLSDVKLQFTYDYPYDEALQQVLNRLSQLTGLPNGVQPRINPVSPIGEIYRYKLAGPPGYGVLDLKTLQDWVLQRRFRAVPGVVDVIGWGGKTKTFELQVDFNKLVAYGLTLPQLLQALNNSNINVGGNTVNLGSQAAVVRGVGLIRSIDDLSNTMLIQFGGNPVLVRDVAAVMVGNRPRLGIAGKDDDNDIVQGIVLMRRGQQSTPTIRRVKAEVERINDSGILPPGAQIERVYDRQDLINITTNTVLHNMVFRSPVDLRAAVDVSGRFAERPHRRGDDTVRAVLRRRSHGAARRVGQPPVRRRNRLRVDRRCDRHHGREDIPAARSDHRKRGGRAGRERVARKAARHLPGGHERKPVDPVRSRNHHRGVHSAVHVERRGRPHFRADGEDLRLRACRRPHRHIHGDARSECDFTARRSGSRSQTRC